MNNSNFLTTLHNAKKAGDIAYDLSWGNLSEDMLANNPVLDIHFSKNYLKYSNPEGQEKIIVGLVNFLNKYSDKKISPDNLLIVNGATQGVSMLAAFLKNIKQIDIAHIQGPTFDTAINIFLQASYSVLQHEPDFSDLKKVGGSSLVYAGFKQQNPSSFSWPASELKATIKRLCNQGGFVIEDDAYGLLEGPELSPLVDKRHIYVGSFSKYIFPGLRIGFVVAERKLIEELRLFHKYFSSHPNLISQSILGEYILSGLIDKEIEHRKQVISDKREVFIKTLSDYKNILTTHSGRSSGFYLWLPLLPKTEMNIWRRLLRKGVATIPGFIYFLPNYKSKYDAIRLSLSSIAKEDVLPAAQVVYEELSRQYG